MDHGRSAVAERRLHLVTDVVPSCRSDHHGTEHPGKRLVIGPEGRRGREIDADALTGDGRVEGRDVLAAAHAGNPGGGKRFLHHMAHPAISADHYLDHILS